MRSVETFRAFSESWDVIASLGEKDAKIRQLKYEDVADMRFVAELERDGFFKKLASK